LTSFECCGVRIDAVTLEDVQRCIEEWVRSPAHRTIHLCNAYTLSLAARRPSLASALNAGALNVADGNPVVWVARLQGASGIRQRVPGMDLMTRVIDAGQAAGLRHYFYGAAPDVLERLVAVVRQRFPRAVVVGAESPEAATLGPEDEGELRKRLASAQPDVVWVALGTPTQDMFIERYLADVPAVFIAVGAAFDFLSLSKRRAPVWVQSIAAEWLFRLVQEPKRLSRRYLIDSPLFFYFAVTRDRRAKDAGRTASRLRS
jgi:N-acetylglucosaminyldiphosphoundecaprenol N-acetyl-beta-D-mannosaminyltransferase